jgi:septum formation protein
MVDPADIDEDALPGEHPRLHVIRLAAAKCVAVAERHPDAVVLAADTVVAVGRRILPKAENEVQARDCLQLLSGRRHQVLTAVTVSAGGIARHRLSTTIVAFKRLTVGEVDAYIASDEWRGKAGGYAIQGPAEAFVRFLSGSHSGVVGLPLFETRNMLLSVGIG